MDLHSDENGRLTEFARNKRRTLLALAVVWAIAGVADAFRVRHPDIATVVTIVHTLATTLLALLWVHYDAEERHYRLSTGLTLSICLVAIIGLPYYLIRSRGWRGIVAILGAVGILVGLVLIGAVVDGVTEQILRG